jgi:hypothetical protein
MANFLERLVAEWFQYQGYFVLQNVNVGRRKLGGYESELDVIVFCPVKKHIFHFETSTDSQTWDQRVPRYRKKFEAGRRHIPILLSVPNLDEYHFKQIALFVFSSKSPRKEIGGGEVMTVDYFVGQIKSALKGKKVRNAMVPEQFPLVRALQFSVHFGKDRVRD